MKYLDSPIHAGTLVSMSHKTKAEKMRAAERPSHPTQKTHLDSDTKVYSPADLTKSLLLTGLICATIILLYALRLRGILQ